MSTDANDPKRLLSRRGALKALGVASAAALAATTLPGGIWAKPLTPQHFAAHDTLNALGELAADKFDARAVIQAVNTFQPLGIKGGGDVLRAWIATARAEKREVPDGIFAVMRLLFEPPNKLSLSSAPEDLKTAARPGYLRHPALGAPSPAPNPDLALTPHYPVLLMGDIPLSLVNGYMLGGHPEPPDMHLAALLDSLCTWRVSPMSPKTTDEVRYLLIHWGGLTSDQAPLVEAQLKRIDDTGGL